MWCDDGDVSGSDGIGLIGLAFCFVFWLGWAGLRWAWIGLVRFWI